LLQPLQVVRGPAPRKIVEQRDAPAPLGEAPGTADADEAGAAGDQDVAGAGVVGHSEGGFWSCFFAQANRWGWWWRRFCRPAGRASHSGVTAGLPPPTELKLRIPGVLESVAKLRSALVRGPEGPMTELALRTPSLGIPGEAAGLVRGPQVLMTEPAQRTPSSEWDRNAGLRPTGLFRAHAFATAGRPILHAFPRIFLRRNLMSRGSIATYIFLADKIDRSLIDLARLRDRYLIFLKRNCRPLREMCVYDTSPNLTRLTITEK